MPTNFRLSYTNGIEFVDLFPSTNVAAIIDADDISGNWDLVYIDSAYSAKTNELARAFHTVGYSDRCFLGWYNPITTSNSNSFNYYFWTEYVTHATIRSAALAAASRVPGNGTTPIRFYGDTSYDGSAR